MPRQSDNPTCEDRRGKEYDLGSLPLGSVFDFYSTQSREFVAMGLLMDVSEYSGRCEAQLIREGDGNFTGNDEDGTLSRIHSLSGIIILNHKAPVGWHGVDEDVRKEILLSKQLFAEPKHPTKIEGEWKDEQKDVRGQEATQEMASGQRGGTAEEAGTAVEQEREVPISISLTKFESETESEVEEG